MTAGSESTGPDCPVEAGDAAVREQTKEAETGGQESIDDSAPAGQSGEDEGTDVPILLYYGDDCHGRAIHDRDKLYSDVWPGHS